MKLIMTVFFTGLFLTVNAQRKNNQISRSIDDNGKTMKLKIEVTNDSTSINYKRDFDVRGLDERQKDAIVNRVVDSLGLDKSLKRTRSNATKAPTDKDLVFNAVMDYVDAFYFGDTSKITRSISPAVYKYGYSRKKDSTSYTGMAMSYQQMIDYVLRVKARNDTAAAQKLAKKVEVLDVMDQTASAKVTAWWGTDYVLLAKVNGNWMITHVLWQSPPATA